MGRAGDFIDMPMVCHFGTYLYCILLNTYENPVVENPVACSEAISKIKSEEEETQIWGETEEKIANDDL